MKQCGTHANEMMRTTQIGNNSFLKCFLLYSANAPAFHSMSTTECAVASSSFDTTSRHQCRTTNPTVIAPWM